MKNAVLIVLTVIFMTGCSEQIELPVSDVVKLHRAAESGNLDLVKQLVEAGVDKNAKVGECTSHLALRVVRSARS